MAELNVQPKRKSHFWLWVLLIAILGIALFIFFNRDNRMTSDEVKSDSTYTSPK